MDILRNLVIAYLLIGLIAMCIMQFILAIKISKNKSLSYLLTKRFYIIAYFCGIIKQIHCIVIWPILITGFRVLIKEDIWTIYKICKEKED